MQCMHRRRYCVIAREGSGGGCYGKFTIYRSGFRYGLGASKATAEIWLRHIHEAREPKVVRLAAAEVLCKLLNG